MGKNLLVAAILALAIPLAAHDRDSDQVTFSNSGGVLASTHKGLSLSSSTLTAVAGLGKSMISGANLGSFSLTTGALTSGALTTGGRLAGGGSLTIRGNGAKGIADGTLFQGTLNGPLTWTLTTLVNGTHQYTLEATANGKLRGLSAKLARVQLIINTGRGFYNGSAVVYSGTTTVSFKDRDDFRD
jgi:hypothetical protein